MARGIGPRLYQGRVLVGLLRAIHYFRGETLTVMFPRQAGKNEVAAWLVGAVLLANARTGGTIVHGAPTFTPQGRISYERTGSYADRMAAELDPGVFRRIGENRIGCGQAEAVFLSASPLAHVAGHTASLLLIGDEAQEIEGEHFERQFRPMAASTGASTVLFGTAWDGGSMLERAAARNRALDGEVPAPERWIRRHYQVGWRTVAESLPEYGRFVEQERERLGAGHPLFQTQYELVAARGAGRLLGHEQLEALEGGHGRLAGPARGERYVAGLDFGGEGGSPGARADATVLTIGRVAGDRCEVVEQVAWRGVPFGSLVEQVVGLSRRWGLARIACDATGLGGPLVAGLERELGSAIEPVVFTAAVKAALGWGLVAAANTGRLAMWAPDGSAEWMATFGELRDCRASTVAGGGLRWGSERGDDHAVSLALCLRAAEGVGAPRIARGRFAEG